MPGGSRRKRASAAVLVVSAVAAGVAATIFTRRHTYSLYDDAFVYLRYLRSVREGCGLRFNCDDPPVEGFSSPLYMGALWLGSFVTRRWVLATQVIGAASVAGTIVLSAQIATRVLVREPLLVRCAAAAVVVIALGLDDDFLLNAVIGLETALAACALAAVALATLRRSTSRTIALLALVAWLARPEAALVLVALPVLLPRRARGRWLVVAVAFVVAATAVRWAIFHDWLPNTARAKSAGTPAHVRLGLEYIRTAFGEFPWIALAPLALVARATRRRAGVWLAVGAAWFLSALRTGGDFYPYSRLFLPVVPIFTAFGVAGAFAALARLVRRRALPLAPPILVAAAAFLAAIVPFVLRRQTVESHSLDDVRRWTAVGRYLKAHYPGARVAAVPIGALAYYSNAHVLDLVGLTSTAVARGGRLPEAMVRRVWIGHECHDTPWIVAQDPEVFVLSRAARPTPWSDSDLPSLTADYYAEWLLLREVKEGRLPMRVVDVELGPEVHVPLLVRVRGPTST